MNIKECLLQYTDTQTEIKILEDKIKSLEKEANDFSVVEASSLSPPFQKHNIKIQYTDIKKKRELNYLSSILSNRYDKLLEQQIKVEEQINKLPTSRLRIIFQLKYLDGYSYNKIANILNEDKSIENCVTADSIKQEHYRYLKEI